ncbi:MFS transporter [Streptacidiphilus jiangxiensis]|uniref:Predicted arabinose efflux permease, MFS family n=1 Tax=Streptacidiphilus jiangxiensis TaxID=235985 RepID=A0A1H7KNY5_STRJI|nr:MFS transporter [Streptacidiphilus jiangxiensis]SEK88541.1 Predicted arabinose efflux permease, MFS family [Streptacidiphilus jiangxiensis]
MRKTLATVGVALRRRDFRWWFGAQVLSASGGMTQSVALSWVILQRTGDAFWLSAFTICSWGPLLLLGPWAGALVDRHDRRRLLLVTQALMLALGALLAALNATGHLGVWVIMAVALLFGVVSSVDGPARQVLVVDLVGRDAVASAVGLWEVALNASRVMGPALGGALLATGGATWCFLVNAAAFVAPLLVLRRLRVPGAVPASARPPRERGAIRAGLRYAWSTPLLRVLLPMAAASGILFTMNLALPTLAQRALHLGGGGYGALLAAFGVGGLPGALLAAGSPEPTGRRVRALALATGASILLTAWAPTTPLAFTAMALTGLTSIWFIASANTLAQLRSAPEMRGRVMGLWSMALPGSVPLTGVAVAAVIQHLGARAGFSVSGVCLALTALLGWRVLSGRPEAAPRSGARGTARQATDEQMVPE